MPTYVSPTLNPTLNPSSLDAEQVLQRAFDQTVDRLRVDAGVTIDSGQMEVAISDTDDSIKIGNGTGTFADVTPTRALKIALNDEDGNPFTALNPLWVEVTASALPNGAATSANQVIEIAAINQVDSDLLAFKAANHTDLLGIQTRQDTTNTSLTTVIGNQTNGTQKSQQVDASGNVQPAGDTNARGVHVIPGDGTDTQDYTASGEAKVLVTPLTNASVVKAQLQDNNGAAVTLGQKVMASSLPVVIASDQSPVAIANFPTAVDTNYGVVGANTVRTASQIGNSTGAANFNAGSTGAQTLRTSANITRNGTELDYNYGTVGVNTLRTAAQVGNATGASDFGAGITGAQTLRVSSNITRNGTELSYNIGTPDANTLRSASILSNSTAQIDYNYGTIGGQSIRTAAQVGNATGAADFGTGAATAQTLRVTSSNFPNTLDTNYGTVGSSTLRVASQAGNATGAADFNAGITGAQTPRITANITRNGTELSYGTGAIDANTLRVASILGNAAGVIDYNYGTVGAQTIRTASEIGNATGAANFGAGATGAQTLRVASNLYDSAANGISSTLINSKQRLDVNVASGGVTGAAVPFQAQYVGGLDDSGNLQALRIKNASTPVAATDLALVVSVSPNSIVTIQGESGTPGTPAGGILTVQGIAGGKDLSTSDIINTSGVDGAVSVGTSAVEARVGGAPLTNRKSLTVFNNSPQIVYWGYNSSVTTVLGTPIYPYKSVAWAIGPALSVFMIAATAANDTRVTEGA